MLLKTPLEFEDKVMQETPSHYSHVQTASQNLILSHSELIPDGSFVV